MPNNKPKLAVVKTLHPGEKKQIGSLGERLRQTIEDYVDEEHRQGRIVTFAEIVGTIEFLKKKYMD